MLVAASSSWGSYATAPATGRYIHFDAGFTIVGAYITTLFSPQFSTKIPKTKLVVDCSDLVAYWVTKDVTILWLYQHKVVKIDFCVDLKWSDISSKLLRHVTKWASLMTCVGVHVLYAFVCIWWYRVNVCVCVFCLYQGWCVGIWGVRVIRVCVMMSVQKFKCNYELFYSQWT